MTVPPPCPEKPCRRGSCNQTAKAGKEQIAQLAKTVAALAHSVDVLVGDRVPTGDRAGGSVDGGARAARQGRQQEGTASTSWSWGWCWHIRGQGRKPSPSEEAGPVFLFGNGRPPS